MNVRCGYLAVLLPALLMTRPVFAQEPAPAKDLDACAAIEAQAERLACYDKLAGRGTRQSSAPNSTPATTAAAPALAPSPAPASAAGRTSANIPGSSNTAPAAATSPGPGTKEAFGLYAAEHPATPKSAFDSITEKVIAVNYDTYGRETVRLEGGGTWQLAGSDPLLANGDSVTINRATLGSYIMTTASGRTHRVRRLR